MKPCVCGEDMYQVIAACENKRKGWWCPDCDAWDDAIGREKLL